MDFIAYFEDFCEENELKIDLSSHMPEGYESAYGTFDVVKNTLFINRRLFENFAKYEALFYLFHEMCHALQYNKPYLFDEKIRKSLDYVIMYNGTCFKLVDNCWKACKIDGDEAYFTEIYLNLPYEKAANAFAYEKVKSIFGESKELDNLYNFWKPKKEVAFQEFESIFESIDNIVDNMTE